MDKVYKCLGAHGNSDRAKLDLYTTPPEATEALLQHHHFNVNVWECACGKGHISDVLKANNHNVFSTDICDYGYCDEVCDFLATNKGWHGDIITNPPYKYALEFAKKAMSILNSDGQLAMLLRIQFLEGQKRKDFFEKYPPKKVYVFSKRIQCLKDGEKVSGSSAVCFAWFVWNKSFTGTPTVEWI